MFYKLFFISAIIFLIILLPNLPNHMDVKMLYFLCSLAGVSLIIFYSKREKYVLLKRQFFKHSNLVILGFIIVHFQYYIDLSLGNIDVDETNIWINSSIILLSFTISLIGLFSFFLGYSSFKKKLVNHIVRMNTITDTRLLTFFAFIFFILYFVTANKVYFLGNYGDVQGGVGKTATYMSLLMEVFLLASLIQKSINIKVLDFTSISFITFIKIFKYDLFFVVLPYLLLVLISGDRGPIITFSLIYLSGYLYITHKRINIIIIGGLLVFGAFAIGVLGQVRKLSSEMSFIEKVKIVLTDDEMSESSSFSPKTVELAGSVRSLHTIVNYVPSNHDFMYGRFQFQQISAAVPFISFIYPALFDDLSSKYKGSASFVTWINQGENPLYGEGTTSITDFYVDFGIIGVLIGMFLFGYIIRFMEITMYVSHTNSIFLTILFMVYFSKSIYIARSSVFFELRTVVWVFIVLSVYKLFFRERQV